LRKRVRNNKKTREIDKNDGKWFVGSGEQAYSEKRHDEREKKGTGGGDALGSRG